MCMWQWDSMREREWIGWGDGECERKGDEDWERRKWGKT